MEKKPASNRKVKWYLWPLVVLTGLLMLVVVGIPLGILALISIPVSWYASKIVARREAVLRNRLSQIGRVVEWRDLEAKVAAGEGTLIVEVLSQKGPLREWWTEDDVIGMSPVVLLKKLEDMPEKDDPQMIEYAKTCMSRYTDPEGGSGCLTGTPAKSWSMPGRDLKVPYPAARIVTIVKWEENPWVFEGDVETVVFSPRVKMEQMKEKTQANQEKRGRTTRGR